MSEVPRGKALILTHRSEGPEVANRHREPTQVWEGVLRLQLLFQTQQALHFLLLCLQPMYCSTPKDCKRENGTKLKNLANCWVFFFLPVPQTENILKECKQQYSHAISDSVIVTINAFFQSDYIHTSLIFFTGKWGVLSFLTT
jgi:hypothetical protein